MKLTDLEPQLVRYEERVQTWTRVLGDPKAWLPGDPTEDVTGPRQYHVFVDTLEEADGISFLCPKCFSDVGSPIGVHSVICWRPRVPAHATPGPGRWEFVGTSLADLSLVAGSSSVLLSSDGGCKAHFHVTNGAIIMSP